MALRRSPLEVAQQHEKKGNLAKAADAYAEHLNNNPADARVLLRFAEIHERLGHGPAAAEAFHRLGVMHAKDGLEGKANAVLRRALKLVPTHVAAVQLLADVLAKGGKKRDALDVLEKGSQAAAATGDAQGRLKMLKRSAELDEGLSCKLTFAQALADSGRKKDAITVLQQAADQLRKHNDVTQDRLLVLERLLQLGPADPTLAIEVANGAMQLRDDRRALASLRRALDTEPHNPDLIALSAAALEGMGESPRALLVFREAARRFSRAGRTAESKRSWISVLRYSPADPEALAAVGPEYVPRTSRPAQKGPLTGIESSEMDMVLSAIQEQSGSADQPSPIADHEFEVTLDELEENKLSIELEITET